MVAKLKPCPRFLYFKIRVEFDTLRQPTYKNTWPRTFFSEAIAKCYVIVLPLDMNSNNTYDKDISELLAEKEKGVKLIELTQKRISDIDIIIAYLMTKVQNSGIMVIASQSDTGLQSDKSEKPASLRDRIRGRFEEMKSMLLPADIVKWLGTPDQAGTIRTSINTLYNEGLLGRVKYIGPAYKYGSIDWLKTTSLKYDTFETDKVNKPKRPKKKKATETA